MHSGDVFGELVVVDVASLNAGPQVATFFGDLGARVIKVEAPGGDPLRRLVDERGVALQWKLANRNKSCVTLDLASEAGRRVLAQLLDRADVLVSAWSGKRLRRFGLDGAALRARHPQVVGVNVTTFGVDGAWGDRPGSGTLAEAATGLAHLTGLADGPPTLAPVGLGDHLGVLHGIIAALVGLLARPRRGGEWFDAAMSDALIGLMGQRLALVARTGVDPGRHGNRFPTVAPRNAYRAADGRWVAITAATDGLTRRLFAAIGQPNLADDPRFRTHGARRAHADTLDGLIAAWIAGLPADTVIETLLAHRVSIAAIDDLPTVLANPYFLERGTWERGDDPTSGPWLSPTVTPGLGGTIRHLGRDLGADDDEVLGTWLGLGDAGVAALRAAGVVAPRPVP